MSYLELINWITPEQGAQYLAEKIGSPAETSFLFQLARERKIPLRISATNMPAYTYATYDEKTTPWVFSGYLNHSPIFEIAVLHSSSLDERFVPDCAISEIKELVDHLDKIKYQRSKNDTWEHFPKTKYAVASLPNAHVEIISTEQTTTINGKKLNLQPLTPTLNREPEVIWREDYWLAYQESLPSNNGYEAVLHQLQNNEQLDFPDFMGIWLIPTMETSDNGKLKQLENPSIVYRVSELLSEESYDYAIRDSTVKVSFYRPHLDELINSLSTGKPPKKESEEKPLAGKSRTTYETTIISLIDGLINGRTHSPYADAETIEQALAAKGVNLGCSSDWLAKEVLTKYKPNNPK